MIERLLDHFRLSFRLFKDQRVSRWLKVALVVLPILYALAPVAIEIPDYVPVVGLLDDLLLIGFASMIFNAVCPTSVVREHKAALRGISSSIHGNLEQYRHPEELRNLGIGLLVGVTVMLLSGMAVGAVWLLMLGIGYAVSRLRHARLLSNAIRCTEVQLPHLHEALVTAQSRLQPVDVNLFVTRSQVMNAYTFGLREPYSVVLTSGLVERMTASELEAVIGHELGHVLFNHVLLINLMSASATGFQKLIFNLWSRSCEFTADAVALQACGGEAKPMVSALLKLASGLKGSEIDLDGFLAQVKRSDAGAPARVVEWLSTHPLISRRIQRLMQISEGSITPDEVTQERLKTGSLYEPRSAVTNSSGFDQVPTRSITEAVGRM